MTHTRAPRLDAETLARIARDFLGEVDPDPGRGDLVRTPVRVAEAWRGFVSGYGVDVGALIADGTLDEARDGLVTVRDIAFYSICEHHLVPFFGRCHVAYLPGGKLVGLSKLARVVDAFARRLQVQERMTDQIADALALHLGALGVAVVVEAHHLCMMMRGCEQHDAVAITRALRGRFVEEPNLLHEFHSTVGTSATPPERDTHRD